MAQNFLYMNRAKGESLGIDEKGSSPEVSRVVFHEITQSAIEKAMAEPRQISRDLVDAQQTRSILDYLVGFNLSPFLWKKIRYGLSAGRVQSVALRLICEREREILAFEAREYWTVAAELANGAGQTLTANLVVSAGKKLKKFDLGNQADVARFDHPGLKAFAHRLQHLGIGRVAREVPDLVRIVLGIIELFDRFETQGVFLLRTHNLPARASSAHRT